MSWRPGELWLDTELLWFRERAGVPALAGFAPPALRLPAPPSGLVASRQRRAAWRRRRYARRVRAAALVLSPALLLPLAALRHGGSHRDAVESEDPPGLTFSLTIGKVEARDRLAPWGATHSSTDAPPAARPPATTGRVHRTVARADPYPVIEWHHATSVGLPYAGSLVDGTELPVDGPDWVTWDPVTDSVPNEPNRLYGNEHTIRTVVSVLEAYRAANPGAPRVVVGDISFKGGGPMRDEHDSHQNGLDVDIYYPRRDGVLRAPVASDEIDLRLAQDLLERFVAAGAQMVFVGYSTGLQGPSGVVIPYANHEYHMHVRFPPPSG